MLSFNDALRYFEVIPVTGAKGLTHTIAASAITDNGNGTVRVTLSAAHGLLANSVVYIEGTTNYDGLREITNVPEATKIDIRAPHVTETPGGSETVKVAIKAKRGYVFVGFRIHLSAAPTTSENFTIAVDSNRGSAFDYKLYEKDFSSDSVTDLIYAVAREENLPYKAEDVIRVSWTNTDAKTFGLELIFAPLL